MMIVFLKSTVRPWLSVCDAAVIQDLSSTLNTSG